jgi:phospholipase C
VYADARQKIDRRRAACLSGYDSSLRHDHDGFWTETALTGAAVPDDPIKHVVVLMLENRSFDHILGGTRKMRQRNELSGLNKLSGKIYPQAAGSARQLLSSPSHETADVLIQLQGNEGVAQNGSFVLNYSQLNPKPLDLGEVMRYHDEGALPAIHTLANTFTVCEQWYSSVPGPTWVNRLFALSGTSLGRVKMPNGIMNLNLHWYDQPTLFDRLNEKSIDWRVYFGDAPLSLLFVHQWSPENTARHHHMMAFYQDAAGDESKFPPFAFIEPAYLQPGANDGHPPHDIMSADALVAGVYNALRANESLWQSVLLVLLFDEHGGFYDHVFPPPAQPPDYHTAEYDFMQYGVRVPAILISPWVGNCVVPDLFDHTSLLKYLQDKWTLNDLGARTAHAASFAGVINAAAPMRTDTPQRISSAVTGSGLPTPAVDALSENQSAIVAMSHNLEAMSNEDPNIVAARSRQVLTGPQSQIDTAVDRVDSFIAQAKAKVDGWHNK